MKKIFQCVLIIIISITALAQSPPILSYQTLIRDVNNHVVNDQLVGIEISILKGSLDGEAVYLETQTKSTNANGLISIAIGEGITNDDFSSIDWSEGPYFIKTETDLNGGSDYSITGITELLSVPYAFYATKAENVFSGNYNDLNNKPDIPVLPNNVSYFNNDLGYVNILNDDNAVNELQNLSVSSAGDTLYLSQSNYVIIPGISLLNVDGVVDNDGNIYNSVIIGNQEWMAENLRTNRFANGEFIPLVLDFENTTPVCMMPNNDYNKEVIYGKLYNWYAVSDSRNICPHGWHVPSHMEWTELTDYIIADRGNAEVGMALKDIESWEYGPYNGTDDYGFKALYLGDFLPTYFWSSTVNQGQLADNSKAVIRMLEWDENGIISGAMDKKNGYSVRCIRD